MATQTTARNEPAFEEAAGRNEAAFEEAAGRARDLNEQIIEATRRAGRAYLDAYETSLSSVADYQEKVGNASSVEWFSTLLNAQADFTREVAKSTTRSARELLQ